MKHLIVGLLVALAFGCNETPQAYPRVWVPTPTPIASQTATPIPVPTRDIEATPTKTSTATATASPTATPGPMAAATPMATALQHPWWVEWGTLEISNALSVLRSISERNTCGDEGEYCFQGPRYECPQYGRASDVDGCRLYRPLWLAIDDGMLVRVSIPFGVFRVEVRPSRGPIEYVEFRRNPEGSGDQLADELQQWLKKVTRKEYLAAEIHSSGLWLAECRINYRDPESVELYDCTSLPLEQQREVVVRAVWPDEVTR